LPQPKRPGWWSRNLLWVVPVLVVAVLLSIGGFVMAVMTLIKSSDAYRGALARVTASAEVQAALGTPIKDGFFGTASITESGQSGQAVLIIPLSGPKGSAMAYGDVTKRQGKWHFDRLMVHLSSSDRRVDLSEKAEEPPQVEKPAQPARGFE
jgi:hypothetical protein